MLLGRKAMTNLDSILKSRHYFADKSPCSPSYGFSSSHVWMWELDHKEGWTPKNWCFQTVVLKKILESPLDCKEVKPVNPKRNQPWILIGKTDAETEAPILWPLDAKRKDSDAGKDWDKRKRAWQRIRWFSSVQSLSSVWPFVTPWTAARQASLSITNSQSLLSLMAIELMIPSNDLILCRPLLLLISLSHHPGLFQWVSSLHQVAKVLELQLQHQSFPSILPMHWQAGSLPLAAPGKFIYTWSCVKQIAVGNWLHSTRSSAWCAMKT